MLYLAKDTAENKSGNYDLIVLVLYFVGFTACSQLFQGVYFDEHGSCSDRHNKEKHLGLHRMLHKLAGPHRLELVWSLHAPVKMICIRYAASLIA